MYFLKNHSIGAFNKGLSFIEVLYAILLLSSTVVILSQISSQSSLHLDRSKRYPLIARLMEQKLTELELEFYQQGPSALKEENPQVFKDYPEFSWSLKHKTSPIGVDFLDTEDADSLLQPVIQALKREISSLVSEVELSIHFDKKGKKASYVMM